MVSRQTRTSSVAGQVRFAVVVMVVAHVCNLQHWCCKAVLKFTMLYTPAHACTQTHTNARMHTHTTTHTHTHTRARVNFTQGFTHSNDTPACLVSLMGSVL